MVKQLEPKLLVEIIRELEEQKRIPLLNLIKRERVVVLVNGQTTTDLMYKVNSEDVIIVIPILKGG